MRVKPIFPPMDVYYCPETDEILLAEKTLCYKGCLFCDKQGYFYADMDCNFQRNYEKIGVFTRKGE